MIPKYFHSSLYLLLVFTRLHIVCPAFSPSLSSCSRLYVFLREHPFLYDVMGVFLKISLSNGFCGIKCHSLIRISSGFGTVGQYCVLKGKIRLFFFPSESWLSIKFFGQPLYAKYFFNCLMLSSNFSFETVLCSRWVWMCRSGYVQRWVLMSRTESLLNLLHLWIVVSERESLFSRKFDC